jgi:hypothetical protein
MKRIKSLSELVQGRVYLFITSIKSEYILKYKKLSPKMSEIEIDRYWFDILLIDDKIPPKTFNTGSLTEDSLKKCKLWELEKEESLAYLL